MGKTLSIIAGGVILLVMYFYSDLVIHRRAYCEALERYYKAEGK